MRKCGKKHKHCKHDIRGRNLTIEDFTIPEFLEWLSHKDINEYIICEEVEDEEESNLNDPSYPDVPSDSENNENQSDDSENNENQSDDNNQIDTLSEGMVVILFEDELHRLLSGFDVVIRNDTSEYTATSTHGTAQFMRIPYGIYNVIFSIEDNEYNEETIEVNSQMNIKTITVIAIQGENNG